METKEGLLGLVDPCSGKLWIEQLLRLKLEEQEMWRPAPRDVLQAMLPHHGKLSRLKELSKDGSLQLLARVHVDRDHGYFAPCEM